VKSLISFSLGRKAEEAKNNNKKKKDPAFVYVLHVGRALNEIKKENQEKN